MATQDTKIAILPNSSKRLVSILSGLTELFYEVQKVTKPIDAGIFITDNALDIDILNRCAGIRIMVITDEVDLELCTDTKFIAGKIGIRVTSGMPLIDLSQDNVDELEKKFDIMIKKYISDEGIPILDW